jgi:hypothetical protein
MIIDPKTWMLTKRLENEIRSGRGTSHMLHPRTIRAVALFEAYNEGVPVGSAFLGLTCVALMLIDDLRQRGLPVPQQLSQASEALVSDSAVVSGLGEVQNAVNRPAGVPVF